MVEHGTLASMPNAISLSPRDLLLLKLLSWTPATTTLLFQASSTFGSESFLDERRLRERLQALSQAGLVRAWSTAHAGGGLQKYFKLTSVGFQRLYGQEMPLPARAFFTEVSPSLFEHTFRLAEAIVTVVRASHESRVTIERFIRENELTFQVGEEQVQPDGFFRLSSCGRFFNLAIEIDQSTESIESTAANSIRKKLYVYQTYQDHVLTQWHVHGKTWERPRLRVVFLTRTVERTHHILRLAGANALHHSRRLVYAVPLESFVTDPRPLHSPIFLDHFGHWQSLVDLHPTASYVKSPVRLKPALENPLLVC